MNNWVAPNVTITGNQPMGRGHPLSKIDNSSISTNFYLNMGLVRQIGSVSQMSDAKFA